MTHLLLLVLQNTGNVRDSYFSTTDAAIQMKLGAIASSFQV